MNYNSVQNIFLNTTFLKFVSEHVCIILSYTNLIKIFWNGSCASEPGAACLY